MSGLKGGLIAGGAVVACLSLAPVIGLGGLGAFTILGASEASYQEQNTTTGELNAGSWASGAVPEKYRDIVQKAGSICEGITPAVISAQIEAESNWNPNSTSVVGAQGIAQFMPATWAGAGKDGDGDGEADINNPIDAIYSQGAYMCAQLAAVQKLEKAGTVSGDAVSLALAAYNAGLGAVESAGGIPAFPETQNYVTKIVTAARTKYATATSVTGSAVIKDGEKYIGIPYDWGGTDPAVGLDCSGFVQRVFADLGVSLPRTADQMAHMNIGTDVTADEAHMQPGDIITFKKPGATTFHHVALYAGDGRILHASWYGTPLGYGTLSAFPGETMVVKRITVNADKEADK